MGTVSRQEVQSMLDTQRAQLVDRLATKHDMQFLLEQIRLKIYNHMTDWRKVDVPVARQTMRRVAAVESRLTGLEYQLQSIEIMLVNVLHQAQITQQTTPTPEVTRQTKPTVPNSNTMYPRR